MQIKVTIDKQGNSSILAMNTLEDLLHDFEYFLKEAKAHSDAHTGDHVPP